MSKQPSPFYDLFEGAYEAILTYPVDEEGIGPHFDAEGNLDLSKGTEVSHELVQVVDLGGGRYRTMLESVIKLGLPTAVCTIYESIPDLERTLHVALSIFNDVIIREAVRLGLPVIDLRLVCSEAEDYSKVSPIEPSAKGGEKIAKAVASLVESSECFLRDGQTRIISGMGQRPYARGLRLGWDT